LAGVRAFLVEHVEKSSIKEIAAHCCEMQTHIHAFSIQKSRKN